MAKSKKSKVLASVAAVALAASLLVGGGTYAYLQGETNDVVNNFDTNKVTVALAETTGNDYDIVPGTSQPKDPKVTVDATVDAYVYVEVKDGTEGLVSYTMADGWTLLDGYENVYYREVSASDAEQSFDVLAGNKVTYDAALENSDMVDAEGSLKEGVDLTFKAYAVQAKPFGNPVDAFTCKDGEIFADDAETAAAAIKAGKPVVLANDLSVSSSDLNSATTADINANGKTLTITGNSFVQVGAGEELNISNGTVEWDNTNGNYLIASANEGSSMTFDNVDMNMNGKSILVNSGVENATINVVDSTIYTTDYYCISTNASNTQSGSGVAINVDNSTLTAADPNGDCAAILMNIPGTLTVTDSEINAGRQAVIVRCGTATIKNSTLNNSLDYTSANWAKYDNSGWGSGNEVPVAVLVVGDRATAYPFDASCTLENVKLVYGKDTDRKPVYAAAYNGQTATVNGVSADMVTMSSDADGVTVNP